MADPSASQLVLLVHANSTLGLVDSSSYNRKVSATGAAAIGGTGVFDQAFQLPANGSLQVPASAGFAFGTGDFTVDFWMYCQVSWASQPSSAGPGGLSSSTWIMYKDSSIPTKLNFRINDANFPTVSTPATQTWEHWAFARQSGTLRIFKNGVLDASYTAVGNILPSTNILYIGYASTWSGTFNGAIDEFRIVKGLACYTTTFTPPTAPYANPDPFPSADLLPAYWSNTKVSMHCDGTIFQDERHNKLTITGNAVVNAVNPKSGTGSAFFSGGYLTIPSMAIASGEARTVEAWVYPTSTNGGAVASTLHLTNIGFTLGLGGGVTDSYGLRPYFGCFDGSWRNASAQSAVPLNTWTHIAGSFDGTTMRLYVNGCLEAELVQVMPSYTGTSYFGASWSANYVFAGYIDEFRVTIGVSRYSEAFTPSLRNADVIQYDSNWQDVVLMMQMQDTGLTDRKMHAVSKFGDVGLSSTQAKFKSVSAYFDGVGDYLTVTPDARLDLGTGDFTIEFWVYMVNTTPTYPVILFAGSSWAAGSVGIHIDHSWSAGKASLAVYDHAAGSPVVSSTASVTLNAWSHVAFTRSGNSVTAFLNGVASTPTTVSGSLAVNLNRALSIGAEAGNPAQTAITAYMQDLRITKSVARYIGNFTPPVEPHPAYDFSTTIGGIVKDHTGAFAARRVNIHSQATGELLGSTVSNATTGEWEFVVDQMCYAVAFDNEVSKRKAIVFDRIEPV